MVEDCKKTRNRISTQGGVALPAEGAGGDGGDFSSRRGQQK